MSSSQMQMRIEAAATTISVIAKKQFDNSEKTVGLNRVGN